MVIVTHEMQFAGEVSDRVIFMDQGGSSSRARPGEVLFKPRKARTREFLKQHAGSLIKTRRGFHEFSSRMAGTVSLFHEPAARAAGRRR